MTTATPKVTKACSFLDFTATASSELAEVAACSTAVGDITVQGDAFGSIELTGVEAIYGDFFVKNATQAVVLNAPTLELVSGQFSLTGNTILGSLNLAQLTTVGTLNFNALPALEKMGLTSGITSAESVIISDTGLTSLDGINVYKLKVFNVNNNDDIESINAGLQSVTDTLSISYNAEKVDVILDDLKTCKNLNLQSINSFSAANLTEITGSLSFVSNNLDKIEIKGLKTIADSLSINKNPDLEEIDFPKLTKIGGALYIQNNEALESIGGFDEVERIGGTLNITGDFQNASFPSLDRVSGSFYFKSTGDMGCGDLKDIDVNGKSTCIASSSHSSSKSSSTKKSSNSSSSDDSSDESSSSGSNSSPTSTSTSTSNSEASSTNSNKAFVKLFTVFAGGVALAAAIF